MTELDYPLEPHRERDEAAARLRALVPTIMQRWEMAVRVQVPAARLQDRLRLHDDVPRIVEEIAQALAIGAIEYCESSPATQAHAEERTELVDYSLAQVIQEYAVLRVVMIETLRCAGSLSQEAATLIHSGVDQSVQEAATRYVAVKERDLRHSEYRQRLLIEGVKDYALFMLDLEGRITRWNAGAERLFGYSEPEVIGSHFCRFRRADQLETTACAQELLTAREHGKFQMEGWQVRKGGTEFWSETVLRPVLDEDGRLTGYANVTRDITERKFLEEQLLQKADELSSADERKNEFLAMLAHELRTPLSAIYNSIYLLEGMEIDEKAEKHLHTIERQSRQLRRLVDDLMDLSRIRSGKVELRTQPVELCRAARDAADTILAFIESRGQELICNIPEGVPCKILADPQRLEQIVTNLLNNASKYTDPGGSIWLTVTCNGTHAAVQVRDSGIGIDVPLLPTIFDLFSQINASEARSHGGLGIGLALVKKLVELHGGTVTATSGGMGQGTEFIVKFPLISAADG